MSQVSKKSNLFRSALVMSVATFCSRILGLVRELLIAMYFGASGMTDAFWVAFRVPNMLRDLFAEGNFNAAFLPVLTDEMQKSEKKGREVFWSSWVALLLLTSIVSINIFIFAKELTLFLAPKFLDKPEVLAVTINSMKILSFFLPLVSLAALSMSFLNVKKVFFVPALAPASLNVMMILSIIFITGVLIKSGQEPIYALAIGGISGGVMQLLVQFPYLAKNGVFTRVKIQLFSKSVKKIFYRMSIGIFGVAATQINLLINTFLATGAGFGSVSYLIYSFRLFQFPVGIFGVSLSNSNLVFFSEAYKAGDIKKAKSVLKESFHLSLMILIPASFILWLFSRDIIFILFERGAFSSTDTQLTASAFRAYIYGLPFYCVFKLLGPTFYAVDKEKIPVFISIFSILVNIVFCVSLVDEYGFVVLALGTSLSIVINSLLQVIFIRKILNIGFSFFVTATSFKILVASTFSFGLIFLMKNYYMLKRVGEWWSSLLWVVALGLIYSLIYGLLLWLLGEGEKLRYFINKIIKK